MSDEDKAGWAGDYMDRKPSSEFLKKYLLDNPAIKVLNVNSPWGSGKSFFLNNWYNDLKLEHACIFFNAWETDYSTEPLVALVTAIQQGTLLYDEALGEGIKSAAINVGSALIRNSVPLIAKGLVKKFVGVELDDLFDGGSDDVSDAAEEAVKGLIKEQAKAQENIGKFKRSVVERLEKYSTENGLKSPAFIFIDELDRCRPTYAIELLERVKHFFELENCRFIIASDSVELAHSIRAVYGERFSSERYLSRFFDAEYRLDNSDVYAMAKSCEANFVKTQLGLLVNGCVRYRDRGASEEPRPDTMRVTGGGYPEYAIILAGMARYFGIQLRELKRYSQQISSMASSLPEHRVHYFWAAFLIFCKAANGDLYREIFLAGRYEAALKEFDSVGAVPTTFAFVGGFESVSDIARLYLRMINAPAEEIHQILNEQEGWRELVCRDFYNDRDEVISYKKLIELAYRLV